MFDGVVFCGGHAVIFCSHVPFLKWYNKLSNVTEKEEVGDYKDPEITNLVENNVSIVKKVPLKFIRAK